MSVQALTSPRKLGPGLASPDLGLLLAEQGHGSCLKTEGW